MMKVASLFSGVAGLEQGLESHDEVAFLCDSDRDARAVLAQKFPGVPISQDITTLRAEQIDSADLFLAGFPCQDVSVVGRKQGLDGSNTPLVKHVFRLAQDMLPDRILLENVQSVRFVHKGRVLNYLVEECERLDYAWAYRVLDSRGFGLPQRRRRLFFLASRVDDPAGCLLSDRGRRPVAEELRFDRPLGFYWTEGRSGHGLTYDAVPPIKSGSSVGIPSPPAVLLHGREVVVPTVETAERLQGFDPGWTAGVPTRSRWRLVGNAVSPPVARWILGRLSLRVRWRPEGERLLRTNSWPAAAWGDGRGVRRQVDVYEMPAESGLGRLSEGDFEWRTISERALSGFIRRAEESRLRYPHSFLDRLRSALLRLKGDK